MIQVMIKKYVNIGMCVCVWVVCVWRGVHYETHGKLSPMFDDNDSEYVYHHYHLFHK